MKRQSIIQRVIVTGILLVPLLPGSCSNAQGVYAVRLAPPPGKAIAAFAEGCFWHAQLVFEAVQGVDSAVAGYAGGHKKNPSYEDVTGEQTGHAETVLVYYDPKVIPFAELQNVFFSSVDPTTKDRQGNDVGSSYRSAVFYQNAAEEKIIREAFSRYGKSGKWKSPIVTEVLPLKAFYRAEQYHQGYAYSHQSNPYVAGVSIPEYRRFCRSYSGRLKAKRRI